MKYVFKNIIKKYYYFCRFSIKKLFKYNRQEESCPICLEDLELKPFRFFPCNRHQVHYDCYEKYLDQENPEKCPFRDI